MDDFLNAFERRFHWLAFPQLFRILLILQGIFFAVQFLRPETFEFFRFDQELIAEGEVWRLLSHYFVPPLAAGGGRPSMLALLFIAFFIMIGFMIGEGLETVLGSFRTSLFIYATAITTTLGLYLMPLMGAPAVAFGGVVIYTSMFILFSIYFPMEKLLLFFFLPVPFFILGGVSGLMILLSIAANPAFAVIYAPILITAAVLLTKLAKSKNLRPGTGGSFLKTSASKDVPALHCCKECGRTERDDAALEFRVAADGEEYCTEHLPRKAESA